MPAIDYNEASIGYEQALKLLRANQQEQRQQQLAAQAARGLDRLMLPPAQPMQPPPTLPPGMASQPLQMPNVPRGQISSDLPQGMAPQGGALPQGPGPQGQGQPPPPWRSMPQPSPWATQGPQGSQGAPPGIQPQPNPYAFAGPGRLQGSQGAPPGMQPQPAAGGGQEPGQALRQLWAQLGDLPAEAKVAAIEKYRDLLPPADKFAVETFKLGMQHAYRQAEQQQKSGDQQARDRANDPGKDKRAEMVGALRQQGMQEADLRQERSLSEQAARQDKSLEAQNDRLAQNNQNLLNRADRTEANIEKRQVLAKLEKRQTTYKKLDSGTDDLIRGIDNAIAQITANPSIVGVPGKVGRAIEVIKNTTGLGKNPDDTAFQTFESHMTDLKNKYDAVSTIGRAKLKMNAENDDKVVRGLGYMTSAQGSLKSLIHLKESMLERKAAEGQELQAWLLKNTPSSAAPAQSGWKIEPVN